MTDPSTVLTERTAKNRPLDGLLVDERDVWVVIGDHDEVLSLLLEDEHADPLTLCRGIVGDDLLLIGEADPLRDRLISNIFGGDARDLG